MAVSKVKQILFTPLARKTLCLSLSSLPSDQNPTKTLISTAVSILRHQRSKSRWSHLQSLFPKGFTPTEASQIVLQIKNNPHLALSFFLWEVFGSWDDEINEKVRVRVRVRVRVCPNVHTFNALMVCFYRDGGVEKVEEIWAEMGEWDCNPNAYSYSVLMAAFCDEGRMGEVEKLWEEMRMKKMEHDIMAYNTIIGGFCRIGEIERGEELFREMELSGIQSTCVTYEHLINGYCEIGDVDSAVLLYKDMCRKGFRAEARTVDGMILLLCNNRRVHEALKLLRVAMGNVEFAPRGKSYETLIKGFCEEGKMEEASKLQSEMVGKGFKPTLEIYSAFIDGYMKQGNKEIAETLRKEMFETQMQQEEN
uniref:Pentatricopeptide repeat-containing protein n=1 Tax=Vitis vinifera TaxID=29760 RepID=F6HQJ0_VITVI